MSSTLYVGNLNCATTEDELRALFSTVGRVESAVVVIDLVDGKRLCYGLVEVKSEKVAREAIQSLNDASLHGNIITVREAPPLYTRGRKDEEEPDERPGDEAIDI